MEGPKKSVFHMMFCAGGIMLSLVLYGLLQEKIMTRPYGPEDNQVIFKNSAYLVLNNRIVAMIIAIIMMYYHGESLKNQAPISKCAAISVSNTIATFCQYEALRYVSFPTQTLGKCGKMIPVMILGMLIGGKKYGFTDFFYAGIVTFGCVLFVLTGQISNSQSEDSTRGILFMFGYLFSDGFTSTFQEKLFKGYKMSTYNQMLYVNLCSAVVSLVTLLFSQELFTSIDFSLNHSDFVMDSFALSCAASFGQMIILITIKEYGALFFATVMTVRQVVSMVISCLLFAHPLSWGQWGSSALVFGTLYYKDANKTPHHHHPPAAHHTPTAATSPALTETKITIQKEENFKN